MKMRIQVLGGHGGSAKGYGTTSFLIDGVLLIDAGSVAATLSVEEQCRIQNILISHCHLDHTKDLAFISDNCFGLRPQPFHVHTHRTVGAMIKKHLLNDVVWPDFTVLPNAENPTMRIHELEPYKKVLIGGYQILPVPVNHPLDAMGFIVEKDGSSVVFTCDTAATEDIWKIAGAQSNLKAVFTEVSFPDSLRRVAELSFHHTPLTFQLELPKIPPNVPIILTHLKPNYREKILSEMKGIGGDRVHVLERDGVEFVY